VSGLDPATQQDPARAADAPADEPEAAELEQQRQARVQRGELIAAGFALALLLLMFVTEWYGINVLPTASAEGAARETAVNAWQALTLTRLVLLLTIVVAIGSVVLRASQRTHGAQTDTGLAVTVLGAITTVLLIYRVLIALPMGDQVVDQKLGALLGLLCAVGITLGGLEATRGERALAGSGVQRTRKRRRIASGWPAR
jgi:hypothetical protein